MRVVRGRLLGKYHGRVIALRDWSTRLTAAEQLRRGRRIRNAVERFQNVGRRQ